MIGSDASGRVLFAGRGRQHVKGLAIMGVVGYVAYALLEALAPAIHGRGLNAMDRVSLVGNLGGVFLSLLLLGMTLRPRAWGPALVTKAHVIQVAICALITVEMAWRSALADRNPPLLSWVTLIILIFPLVVPTTPRRTFFFSLACASTVPLALVVMHLVGISRFPPAYCTATVLPPVVAVAAATLGALRISGPERRLGNYELEEEIGEGGRGIVWRARHRFVAKQVAVKFIKPEILRLVPVEKRREVRRDFFLEANLVSQLTCVQTVDLYDFGEDDRGRLYLIMEMLHGLTMEALVDSYGALPPARVKAFLCELIEPLNEAHRKMWRDQGGAWREGIVHRDIKPANVFVVKQGTSYDRIKVVDWGIAFQGESLVAKGTPGFMAPEQIAGETLTPRTDIYSLGCLLYWLLTGGEYVFSGNPEEMSRRHLGAEVAVPPSRRLAETQPGRIEPGHEIPAGMDALVMACLEKDPDRRPQSVLEIRERIDACDIGSWSHEDAAAWWSRHEPKIAGLGREG